MRKKLDLSPNFSKIARSKKMIKFIIIHYTGMQSEIESIKRLKNKKSKVSCHYLINHKGCVTQLVLEKYTAWHAGKSRWGKFKNLNKYSIGIELQNKGHDHGYESFSSKQIKSLINLCKILKKKYFIKKENFLGHSDIAPLRKIDPGEKFPWKQLSKFNIGKWYKVKNQKLKLNKMITKREIFFNNLHKIGYRYFKITKKKKTDFKVVSSFQRRYLQSKVNGKIDKKTAEISHFLANE